IALLRAVSPIPSSFHAPATPALCPPSLHDALPIFRAPQGWKRITGPVERSGDELTATLHSESAGRPSITTRVAFVYRDGNWKLATRSVCEGVRPSACPSRAGAESDDRGGRTDEGVPRARGAARARPHVPGRSADLSARPQRGRQIYAAAMHRR